MPKPDLAKKQNWIFPTDEVEPDRTAEGAGGDADIAMDDPIPQGQDTYAEPPEANPASPHADPPSPARDENLPSPTRDIVNPPTPSKGGDDDVVITGTGHTILGNPVALSKHTAKDDLSAIGKGKWNADLSSYAHLNAQDIHSGFLNRLYTSRDYEASFVNLMKERYEVTTIFLFCPIVVYQFLVAPKWRFMIPI